MSKGVSKNLGVPVSQGIISTYGADLDLTAVE